MVKVLLNPFLYIPVFQIYWSSGGGGYIGIVCLSVCPSLCGNFCPARRCVAYIPDPNTTLTLDLKVKFTGFLTCFCVWYITIFWFDIGIPYLDMGQPLWEDVLRTFIILIQCWPLFVWSLSSHSKEGVAHIMLNFPIGVAWKIGVIKLIINVKKTT